MKLFFTSLTMCLLIIGVNAQIPNPLIKNMLNEMSNDSILNRVNELSGEKSCIVNGSSVTIKNRVSNKGNDLAANYLKERMQSFGFTVTDQVYSSGGRNVFAEQKGAVYPDKKYIISAHYDAMADYCADDDASGCSAVLETARILGKHKFKYTIVYAFWDEEELGLLGSAYYARQAKINNETILGVFNIDMAAYDSNNDFVYDIHTKSNSLTLSDKMKQITGAYNFKLVPNVINPGTDRSDHGSFWANNYSAICFGEAFISGDANPSYHKSTDRIKLFNLPYYYEICHLGLATVATFAEPLDVSGISASTSSNMTIQLYPNPAKNLVNIKYTLAEPATIEMSLQDIQGKESKLLLNEIKSEGEYQFNINTSDYAAGIYLLITKQKDKPSNIQKLVIEKQ